MFQVQALVRQPLNAPVAQLDQSTSLRTRRSQVRALPGVPNDGLIAQLVERLLCKQRVRSSSLRGSTMMLPSSNRSGRHPFTVEIYGFESRWQYRSILSWRNGLALLPDTQKVAGSSPAVSTIVRDAWRWLPERSHKPQTWVANGFLIRDSAMFKQVYIALAAPSVRVPLPQQACEDARAAQGSGLQNRYSSVQIRLLTQEETIVP